jgi:hypothetical protein
MFWRSLYCCLLERTFKSLLTNILIYINTDTCALVATREGWPLLNVETEANMETHGVHMKGVLSWLVRWARRADTRDFCRALAALVGTVQNILFPLPHLSQSAVPRRLSLIMCLWLQLLKKFLLSPNF